MIVDRAVYRDGRGAGEPDDFAELLAACQSEGAVPWLGLYESSSEEFSAVAREFGLHDLAVEDAVKAHQRPELERYGDVPRPATCPLLGRDGDGLVR
jgi:magnesium transporter